MGTRRDLLHTGAGILTGGIVFGAAGYVKGNIDGSESGEQAAYSQWHQPDSNSPVQHRWRGVQEVAAGEIRAFKTEKAREIYANVSIKSEQPFDFFVISNGAIDEFEDGEAMYRRKGAQLQTMNVNFEHTYTNTFPFAFVIDNTDRGSIPPTPILRTEVDITIRVEEDFDSSN